MKQQSLGYSVRYLYGGESGVIAVDRAVEEGENETKCPTKI